MTEELVQGNEFTTPENYDPKVKAKAYEMLLTTELSLQDIAIDLGLNVKVVAAWSKRGHWLDRKHEIEAELFKSAEDKYRAFITQNRTPVAIQQLRIAQKVEGAVEKVVDEMSKDGAIPNDMKVKRMAEAMSSIAAVSARVVGITDKPFSDNVNPVENNRKVPLIMVNVQPSVPSEVKITEA